MDVFMNLLNVSQPMKRIRVPTGVVNGSVVVEDDDVVIKEEQEDPQESGIGYVQSYKKTEEAKYASTVFKRSTTGTLSCVDSVGGEHSGDPMVRPGVSANIYNSPYFYSNSKRTTELAIDTIKDDFLKLLQSCQVVIVRGHTGCGKTTQIPQFILDDSRKKNEYCNIVVTQPRKIAAISVAKRVCDERGWPLGTVCGYQVSLDKQVAQNTMITYATTGVLLQKLIGSKNLNEFTHIIVDEIHERTQETDFLLLILRKFLHFNSPNVKIVLMSATFDTVKFAQYFRTYRGGVKYPAPTLWVVKQASNFETCIHTIDEFREITQVPEYKVDEPVVHDLLYSTMVKLIEVFDSIDLPNVGHVLVFLPGIHEIETAYVALYEAGKHRVDQNKIPWMVLPLHSSIPSYEQARVFANPGRARKIILSTNIAESSITVPDVAYVIDFCLTKSMSVNKDTQYQCLQMEWASHTNCIQRAGRVGRVRAGKVYRLVTEEFYKNFLPKDTVPEMLQASLDRIVLCAKRLQFQEPPRATLALALDPPLLESIDSTILNLKEVGALLPTYQGELMKMDGDITFLGSIMATLPIDVKLAKLVCLGYLFSCLDECIIIAAGCSLPNIFSTPFRERLNAYTNKLFWADGSFSDLMAHYSLYKVWERNISQSECSSVNEQKRWCQQNYLSFRSMNEWTMLVKEIKSRLNHMGIVSPEGAERVDLDSTELSLMLKVVISGAFYPNYFTRSCDGGQVDEQEAFKTLKGLNPLQTVYFRNMDMSQPGPLYAERIKQLMAPVSKNVRVSFDSTSSVYVTFNDVLEPLRTEVQGRQFLMSNPSKISINVYKAIRMRQLKMSTTFPALKNDDAWELAKKFGIAKGFGESCKVPKSETSNTKSVLPALNVQRMEIQISHVIDAGHFYAQPTDDSCNEALEFIFHALNSHGPLSTLPPHLVQVGTICAAHFSEDGNFYRCKVLALSPMGRNLFVAQIIYMDYGNTEALPPTNLYEIPNGRVQTIPAQAMECVLCGIQPSVCLNPNLIWSRKANEFFKEATKDKVCTAQIYSVVDNIVSVDLYHKGARNSMTEILIKKRFAEAREESYNSRENHACRQKLMDKPCSSKEYVDLTGAAPTSSDIVFEPPTDDMCSIEITLKGPNSPLEMKVYSIFSGGSTVNIDPNSINSVLLDSDPQDPHTRLLVAACVSQKQHTDTYVLRHTTLMPNIHGFPSVMALIFAPKILTKANDLGTHYVSLLCGLGENPKTQTPIYPAHDISVVLDTEINKEAIELANEIRYCMNKIVENMEAVCQKEQRRPISSYHRDLKDRVIRLLEGSKKSQPRTIVKHATSWNRSVYQGRSLPPGKCELRNEIWGLHSITELTGQGSSSSMKLHLEELRDYAGKVKEMEEEVTCELCNVSLHSLSDLRMHLLDKSHSAKVARYS